MPTSATSGPLYELDAGRLATELTGDSIGTNILMLGYAAQKGLLPVTLASLQQAIRLNGTFVDGNLRTFALGRLAAHAPQELARELGGAPRQVALASVDDVLVSRMRLLTDYQNEAYAGKWRTFVDDVRVRVTALKLKEGEKFVREVALTLAKLMAYKDEYEVARLYTDPKFMQRMREQFSGNFKMSFSLGPLWLPGKDSTGRPKKYSFGSWMMPVFRVLAALKGLRGTPFDVLGWHSERRMERRLIEDYRALIQAILPRLTADNLTVGIEVAQAASQIAGYGPVKDASVQTYRQQLETLMRRFDRSVGAPPAQAQAA
jgi:indolepyruvate ferredoxin oxidoreductase